MEIINLYDHNIVVMDIDGVIHEVPPSPLKKDIRIKPESEGTLIMNYGIFKIPVKERKVYTITGLPNPDPNIMYVIPIPIDSIVKNSDRKDIITLGIGLYDNPILNGEKIIVRCFRKI